ncbi:uncharacterized protein LOC120780346 [Bactrocera tryoni]|uniref:uncharacterized protein LOC120780346 n=1 Tax=Bactrocera tryoni TaxID=59916 RepID=UPI001A97433B|nr:uncharacterized protein LOC120780346 [Bactrocera tryoni]
MSDKKMTSYSCHISWHKSPYYCKFHNTLLISSFLSQSNMDVNMASSSTPTMRSAVSAPRSEAGPIAAHRTNTAPAAPRTTTGSTATTAPRQSTPAVPADLQPIRCPLCRRPHRLSHCGIFKGMPPMQRQQVAQAHGYCLNCLATSHATQEYPSQNRCQICVRAHHTLLHRATRRPPALRTSGNVRRSQRTPVTAYRRRGHAQVESRSWRQNRTTSTRRHPLRPQSRRSTGLSSVVATLQQLQRLLG